MEKAKYYYELLISNAHKSSNNYQNKYNNKTISYPYYYEAIMGYGCLFEDCEDYNNAKLIFTMAANLK